MDAMHRKPYYILLLLLCLVSSCGSRGTKSENPDGTNTVETEEKNEIPISDEVELTVHPSVFKADEADKIAKCTMHNNSEHEISFGSRFVVEKWNGQEWIQFPFIANLGFNDVLYGLLPRESEEIYHKYHLSFSLAGGLKEKGRYRLLVPVERTYEPEVKFDVSGEFTVE